MNFESKIKKLKNTLAALLDDENVDRKQLSKTSNVERTCSKHCKSAHRNDSTRMVDFHKLGTLFLDTRR